MKSKFDSRYYQITTSKAFETQFMIFFSFECRGFMFYNVVMVARNSQTVSIFCTKKGKITYLQKNTLKLSNCNYTFFNKKLFHKKGHENKSRLTVYAKKWILKTKLFYQWLWRQFAQLETSVKNCLLKIIIYLWNNQETLFKKM